MGKYIKIIKNDMFNIAKRLKKIDKNYFVVFNLKKNKFEVHIKNQVGGSYALTCPYDTLDKRLLDYVLKTSLVYNKNLFKTLENENQKLIDEKDKRNETYIKSNLGDFYRVLSGSTKSYDLKNGMKTKWL